MPTAGRLAAAVMFGALAWYVSQLIIPLFPDGTAVGRFAEINAVFGIIVGWVVAGSRAGGGWVAAVGYGLTATVALVFWGLFLHSLVQMIRQSLRKQYDGAVEALVGVFELMLENGAVLIDARVMGTLVVGGIIAGLVTEYFGRNFR